MPATGTTGTSKPAAVQVKKPEPPATATPARILLDQDKLNMGDVMRARKMFAALDTTDPWHATDPWQLLGGTYEERQALTIWCFRSRIDPSFTWAQACTVDFGDLDLPEAPPPPPTPEPVTNGSGPVETR